MKKYLINGAMALIVGGFIVSCSHDDISQPATVDQMTKSFDEMFTELYGPIAPNHNWGFETVAAEPGEEQLEAEDKEERAATRSAERAATRTPAEFGWEVSSDYDAEFNRNFYLAVLDLLPEEVDAKNKLNNYEFESNGKFQFSIIYAQTSGEDEVGYYYYNPATQTIANHTRVAFVNNIQNLGNYVRVTQSKYLSQIVDWGWKGMSPYDGADPWKNWYFPYQWSNAKIFTVNIPAGYRVGFYIKQGDNIMYSNQTLNTNDVRPEGSRYYSAYSAKDNNTFLVGLEDWTFRYDNNHKADCNDVIISVNRKADNPPTVVNVDDNPTPIKTPAYQESYSAQNDTYMVIKDQGRVFCEDIATANMGVKEDIDYNDIVFDARVWRVYNKEVTIANGAITESGERNVKYKYDISMLAAGGTIPENVGINNDDVHDVFGVGLTFMVNTWTPKSTAFGQYNTPTNVMLPKKEISYTLSYDQVDPDNININTIPIEVKYSGNKAMALNNREINEEGKSTAPYKLCLPLGTLWPIERVNIQQAYSDFSSYVSSPDNLFYKGTKVEENLYTSAPTSSIQDGKNVGDVVKIEGKKTESTWWVVWTGEATGYEGLDLYDYNFADGQTVRLVGTGTITVTCGAGGGVSLVSNGDMSEDGYIDVKINANQASNLKQGILVDGKNFKLTKIVVF